MAALLDIRRRIRSVKSTQQITRAMKMVAAARLRRAQDRIFNARPYANQMMALLSSVVARATDRSHPLLAVRPIQRQLLVLVTADRGLCGGFNANLIRAAQSYVDEHRDRDISILTVGRKGRDYFLRRPVKVIGEHINILAVWISARHSRLPSASSSFTRKRKWTRWISFTTSSSPS
jgi:F-type H+-transporting ATPase subunit gamma